MQKNSRIFLYLTAIVIIAFIVFKSAHLALPYFWDEIGVFGSGINHQYHNGLSMMPKSVPPLVSRGHPLFFTFLYVGYAKLLGSNSVTVVHSLSLLLSVVLLLSLYYAVSKFHSKAAAFYSVALLAAQPLFVAQSALALPEVLLAVLIWWALYTYTTGKYFWFMLFAALAALTKETGLLVPVVCAAFTFWQLLWGTKKLSNVPAKQYISILIAPLVFGVFLLVQKQQNGWYFFSYHINAVQADIKFIVSNVGDFVKFILYKQGRNQWILIIAAGLLAGLLFNKFKRRTITTGILPIGLILIFAVITFYAATFYMNRYLLCLYPFIAMMVALSLTFIFEKVKWMPVIIVGVLCGVSLSHLDDNKFAYDDDMAYLRTLHVTQQAIDKVAELPKGVVYANFPAYFAVTETENGFKNTDKLTPTKQLTKTNTKYIIECEYSWRMEDSILTDYAKAYVFKDGFAVANLYVKK